jgi:hypothetical protein
VKSRKKKPWLAWIIGFALCLIVPSAIIGKSSWNELAARIGSNKVFVNNVIKDHYAGKDTSTFVLEGTRDQVKTVLDEAQVKLGKCLAFDTADTVPTFRDTISKGWELTYNLPVQFEKGYKTFIVRVRNEGFDQKVVSMSSIDGITAKNSIKRQLKESLSR